MPNLNYAQQWAPELLQILTQGALTSPFIIPNVRWLDAKTFHFTQMSTTGYKNHKRTRKLIAKENGITGYVGSAKQNTQMLTLLKSGKLKRI